MKKLHLLKKKLSFFLNSLLVLTVLFSCANEQIESEKIISSITIPNKYFCNDSLIIEEAKYVFLDSNIILGEIAKIILSDTKIIIHDGIQNAIFIFDTLGKFQLEINKVGNGPGEYKQIKDIAFNEDENILTILDMDLRKFLNYNIQNGDFINSFKAKVYPVGLTYYQKQYIGYNPLGVNYKDDKYKFSFLLLNTLFEFNKGLMEHDPRLSNFRNVTNIRGWQCSNHKLLLCNRFDRKLIIIDSNGSQQEFELIFNKVEDEDYKEVLNIARNYNDISILAKSKVASNISDICISGALISFTYSYNLERHIVIYHLEQNKILLHSPTNSIKNATTQLFLSNIPYFQFPTNAKDDYFATIVEPIAIKAFFNQKNIDILSKYINCQQVDRFLNYKLDGNPIIAFYKFKYRYEK